MMIFYAPHWSELPFNQFCQWGGVAPNFSPEELSSKGDGSLKVHRSSLVMLQGIRDGHGGPLIINSAYRDPEHNARVGGSPKSQHTVGRAFDIHITGHEMGRHLEDLAIKNGATAIGRYKTFIHVDNRPPKGDGSLYQWGEWL